MTATARPARSGSRRGAAWRSGRRRRAVAVLEIGTGVLDVARGPAEAGVGGAVSVWRRWTVATFLGETAGFLVPVLAVLLGADQLPEPLRILVLVSAGAGEGAVLGAAQAHVLGRELRRLR